MKTFITDIEDQVEQTLLNDMGREVGVVSIHSDNVEDVAWHLRSNQYDYGKYPYILFYCGLADTIADDTTTLMPTVSITLTAYVVYAEDGENYRYNQKRVCEHTGLRAWVELAQRRFGSDITSQEPMTGFTLQREINAEELAMWRLEGELNINVDLNELYQINNAGSFYYGTSNDTPTTGSEVENLGGVTTLNTFKINVPNNATSVEFAIPSDIAPVSKIEFQGALTSNVTSNYTTSIVSNVGPENTEYTVYRREPASSYSEVIVEVTI